MLPAYPEYPDVVSLDQIEQAFLADRNMYLQGEIQEGFLLQIYHSELDDAEDNECVLILIVAEPEEEGIIFNSEAYALDKIVHSFRLDCSKAMWLVDKDVPRFLTEEELRNMGHTDEEIQQILKNREA